MATKNGVPFLQMLLSAAKYSLKAPYVMTPRKITIHNTDNQMPAQNEISYMIGNSSVVGFHIGIDEREAVQGVPFNRNTFHAGDGGNGYGNRNTIGVEMCRNYDRSRGTTNLNDPLRTQFEKTFQNTIKVVAQLCVDLSIVPSFNTIKQHKDWSGKHCPSKILNDKRWNELVNGIVTEYRRLKGQPVQAGSPIDELDYSTYRYGQPLLYGMAGVAVGRLQDDLNKLGIKVSKDNSFGPATKSAVITFQRRHAHLADDGDAGPATQKQITADLAALIAPKPAPSKPAPSAPPVAEALNPKEDELLKTSSVTTLNNFISYLESAARKTYKDADGKVAPVITQKWIDQAKAGTLTVSDAFLIKHTIQQRLGQL